MKIKERVEMLDKILDRYSYYWYRNIEIFLMFGKTIEGEKALTHESGVSIKINTNTLKIKIEIPGDA